MATLQENSAFQVIPGGLQPPLDSSHNPAEPSSPEPLKRDWTAAELAIRYETSARTVQKMIGYVQEACYWLNPSEPKTGNSNTTRYTALCVQYLDDLDHAKAEGQTSPEWVAAVKSTAPEDVITPTIDPEPEDDMPEPPQDAGGALATTKKSQQATSLVQFNFGGDLSFTIQSTDTTGINSQTEQARAVTAQSAHLLQQAVEAKFKADLAQVLAQNENLVAGIQASSVVGAVEDLGLGKKPDTQGKAPTEPPRSQQ